MGKKILPLWGRWQPAGLTEGDRVTTLATRPNPPPPRSARHLPQGGRIWLSLVALLLSAPALADTLVDNVEGITIDDTGGLDRFTGLVIAADGRIKQVLHRGDKRPGRPDYLIDGKGRVLLPGMIDSHVHLTKLGFAVLSRDSSATGSPVETRARPEDRDLALATAQDLLLARGVTAVADMGTTIEDWQAFRRAGDHGRLRLRIMAYAAGTEAMELIGGPGPSPWLYDDRLRLNGVKLVADGALGSRGASLKAPYADAPGSRGRRITADIPLKNLMSRAAIDKFQVAVHAIGDEANAAVLTAISDLAPTYGGDRRWRIEHAQHIDPGDVARFGQHGIIASMQPGHQTTDRTMAEARLGQGRLAGAYAWKSVQATGAKLAFGSDAPAELPDPWAGWAAAITRQGPDGQPFGGWQVQERVTREEALAAYTANGAYAGFAEGRFGRLVKGERADFLFVDRDPLLASPSELRETKVLQVYVNGRLVRDQKSSPTGGGGSAQR